MKKFLISDIVKIAIVLNMILLLGSVFVIPAKASVGSVGFSWLPNSASNIAGYKIYYGTTPGGGYPNSVDIKTSVPVSNDGRIHGVVSGLTNGITYYFVCTAYDNTGNESAYTPEVVYTVGTTVPKIITIQIK
jgi:hypothetical protein